MKVVSNIKMVLKCVQNTQKFTQNVSPKDMIAVNAASLCPGSTLYTFLRSSTFEEVIG